MNLERVQVTVCGAVQGVGFRPFVYRLASELNLTGWVSNSPQGVFIDAEGEKEALKRLLVRLQKEKPPHSLIQKLEFRHLNPQGFLNFEIRHSGAEGRKSAIVLPDIATCAECVREIFEPDNRRYLYPFTNCTHCGPRFSIIEALPYDRANTSMKGFPMCPRCKQEYEDPRNRRFHAQPNACPQCGPQLELWDSRGRILAKTNDALLRAAQLVRRGAILAMKGIGGFQLLVDARDEDAVARLRNRKRREEKPFAVMFPSLASVRVNCRISPLEERLLRSPAAPIVLLSRQRRCPESGAMIAPSVAPRNPRLGAMLSCSPLHHLLMRELGFAVVATSGNLVDEPICTDEREVVSRLGTIADAFLVHNRPIVRHMDDSVARTVHAREMILRRARGYAPMPIGITTEASESPTSILALGAHQKNTVALGLGGSAFISQHIGDLGTKEAHDAFRKAAADLPSLYSAGPAVAACDLHPDYVSSRYAEGLRTPVVTVQHHYAHVLACMAENELRPPALGVAWDGTGLGTDGTIWGGEFLQVGPDGFERIAHLRTFRLPGGEASVKEPRRSALGLLYEVYGDDLFENGDWTPLRSFSKAALESLRRMLARGVNVPMTSSAGRLFDGIASLVGLRQRSSFEGQAAMELEFAIQPRVRDFHPFRVQPSKPAVIDWVPLVQAILQEVAYKDSIKVIAAKFHNSLVEMIVHVARIAGLRKVVLTGGCFQNKILIERAVARLREEGFEPHWHRKVPPNDGGIALGQIVAAMRAMRMGSVKEGASIA